MIDGKLRDTDTEMNFKTEISLPTSKWRVKKGRGEYATACPPNRG